MNNESYIVINGKKAELTEEQLKELGIEVENKKNNPFGEIKDKRYCYISSTDDLYFTENVGAVVDKTMYNNANWFKDEYFANQVMLHQQLYRKLLKYAYDNNAEVTKEDWKNRNPKYFIYYELRHKKFHVDSSVGDAARAKDFGIVYFINPTVAENAIRDVIKPFMKEHLEFVW